MTLPVTALTATICAIMLLVTAMATVRQRFRTRTPFGAGDSDAALISASRSHGNLAEHAPLFVIMTGLLELSNANHWLLAGVATVFLAARALHIIGLHQPMRAGGPPLARAIGVIGTWLSYAALIVWILFEVVTANA